MVPSNNRVVSNATIDVCPWKSCNYLQPSGCVDGCVFNRSLIKEKKVFKIICWYFEVVGAEGLSMLDVIMIGV